MKVTAPEEDEPLPAQGKNEGVSGDAPIPRASPERPSDAHQLKHESNAPEPLHEKVPTPLHAGDNVAHPAAPAPSQPEGEQAQHLEAEPQADNGRETPELQMPGSFDVPAPHHHHHLPHVEGGWMGLFKKMHIRQ